MQISSSRISQVAFALTAAFLPLSSVAQILASPSTVIQKHVPELVNNSLVTKTGIMSEKDNLHLALNLANRDQAGLEALLADLYNPQSPNYRHWWTPQEVDLKFGPTKEQFNTLLSWAQAKGMTVTFQASNMRIIEIDAPVSVVNSAFHVTETTYHDGNINHDFHAPDREPTTDLPFQLLSVDGLENAAPMHNHLKKGPTADLPRYVAAPLSSSGIAGSFGGGIMPATPLKITPHAGGTGPGGEFLPSDIRAAYYGSGSLTGQGQYVAIFSFDGYLTSDVTLYYQNVGQTSSVPVTNVLTGGYAGNCYSSTNGTSGTCDDGEQILDIVQVQGMAPGLAGIRFYEGSTANTEVNQMYTDNIAKVVTSSWGGGGFGTSTDTYFQDMAAVGITYFNATGDDGAFNKYTYGAPSLSPYIVQVGGTDLVTSGPGGSWVSETGWSDSGGGFYVSGMSTSSKYTIPTWQSQTGVITSTNKGSTAYRNAPDMSAEANFDNPTADNGAFLEGYGGTSFATPRMAGYFALANQQYVENGHTAGFGAIMSSMYTAGLAQIAATGSYYHDLTSGSNPAYEGTGSYTAVAGYDLVTGWGSPNGTALMNYFAGTAPVDFGLPASASMSETSGGSGGASIPITGYNGYSGNAVPTAIGGLPSGWGAVYTSGTGTTSTPLAIYISSTSGTLPGSYPLTLTVTDSSNSNLTHTMTLYVEVEKRASGDFTMTANAVSVNAGGLGSTAITVTQGTGLAGPIAISITNVPAGITVTQYGSSTSPDVFTAQSIPVTLSVSGATTPGTYAVQVTGTAADGIMHTVNIPVTVTTPPNLLTNGSFETGALTPWATTTSCAYSPSLLTSSSGFPPEQGSYFGLLAGTGVACSQTLSQQVSIPIASGGKATLGFWQWMLTNETGTTAVDTLTATLIDDEGVSHTLGSVSNLSTEGFWTYNSYDVSLYQNTTVTITFTAVEAGATITDFLVDNVTVTAP